MLNGVSFKPTLDQHLVFDRGGEVCPFQGAVASEFQRAIKLADTFGIELNA